ncbi:type IX secretion system sortase PorU [Niastella caeni]|uniref:Type IX secretion system sortase PorU n=1 Tax=Niastella caeni TaxID=2569763 RepID=A0A4S8I049_9BACT|nr:type IX secretion system sortase PorU [Niastella caeni]THU41320.1 type IX secretion system sortase PorU [Niastella caeni]
MRSRPVIRLMMAGIFLVMNYMPALSQRMYTANSVLAMGNWYKISTTLPGIYKIDLPFLSSLGVNTSSLSSSSVRLFGNGGQMLPEKPLNTKPDDLIENALWVEDGGDGQLNGSDYILFYAGGPHAWIKDSISKSFHHQKNIYSDTAYYYLSIGQNGKRITTANVTTTPNTTITQVTRNWFHELDTVNFLSSGRQWYGEEFSGNAGKSLSRTYTVNLPNILANPATIASACVARSFGTTSRFTVSINNQQAMQITVPATSTGAYDPFAMAAQSAASFSTTQSPLSIRFDYTPGSSGSQGWLDWVEVHARVDLSMTGNNQLQFHDWNSVGAGNVGSYTIKNAPAGMQVWDITNALEPVRMQGALAGSDWRFVNECSRLREYIAFSTTGFLTPVKVGAVPNQNLHGSGMPQYIIITHPDLLGQAQRLAQYHQQRDNLAGLVVTVNQVYNEFSSGSPDPAALRDFVKMFYDRAGGDSSKAPKYLLLFGDASFDYRTRISNNTNLVPCWESPVSLDPLATYTSDDFFGLLGDNDDINGTGTYLLDVGIGRIPARNVREAKAIVDKILAYNDVKSLGPWRNEVTFVADDEDNNLHLQDAEIMTQVVQTAAPQENIDKIYLDAFRQESSSAGSRYPAVNQAINNKIYSGTLMWNYAGHGGYRRLGEEVVLDQDIINTFNNPGKLPLFITATCDVAPYDNPLVSSIGENLLLRERTGAIALMTTTRLVFAFSNRIMNENYLKTAFQKKSDSSYRSLGEAVRMAKNVTYNFLGDVVNNRKFTLLGDPALTLAFPVYQVKTTAINGQAVTSTPDTLKALSEYTISGTVQDNAGNTLNDFNGTIYPTIFDKVQTINTLGNDAGSQAVPIQVQKNILFKGKATVNNGRFSFSFIVPKDISYQYGNGKISYYTDNGNKDGNGVLNNIIIGGSGNGVNDPLGPTIKAYLNDEKFVNGSITNDRPILLVKLADSSGINILGTGIGHDLVATLDNDQKNEFVLNSFYESDVNNYRQGTVRFQLPVLAAGAHTLTIKAWDAANNSGEATIDFRVVAQQNFTLSHVLNYPNPFTTHTTFWFEHNRPGEELLIRIQVYTITGKLVKNINKTIFSPGNRSSDVEWNGRDEYGDKIGRGVYLYRLRVQTADGKAAEKLEKLFIL